MAQNSRSGAIKESARRLVRVAIEAASGAHSEQPLRHAIEAQLEAECRKLGIPWIPYQLELPLRGKTTSVGFADVVHGAVLIEYEPPKSFGGIEGAKLRHAREQAVEYVARLAYEEGRNREEYTMIAWDGSHITFGRLREKGPVWHRLVPFDESSAQLLLGLLESRGTPLVHPRLLEVLIGPESAVGATLLPGLFAAVCESEVNRRARPTKTTLLYTEWKRLFGQAVGIQTERLVDFLRRQSQAHGVDYEDNVPAYLFALHTYIAIAAKLTAGLALPARSQDIRDHSVALFDRFRSLESGKLFVDAGITNMLTGDFFSWYVDDENWDRLEGGLSAILSSLRNVDFDMQTKRADSVRDLFKGLYQTFVPRELRHALGEVYTPDWLAGYALDRLGWAPEDDLLDPTCGTGTFLLEALRRRIQAAPGETDPRVLLQGIYGLDLNPLAILAAKASIVVVVGARLRPDQPVTIPVYLADAINVAEESRGACFEHTLPTEKGEKRFEVPSVLVRSAGFYGFFNDLRRLINSDMGADEIARSLSE